MFDVIIIGSGPGGASAAIRTAKHKSVLLLDAETFPRDKVCGDGMPFQVMELLNEMNINAEKILHHHKIENCSIVGAYGTELFLREARETNYSMSSKRRDFDAMLHNHALKQGAHFEQARVTGLLRNPDGTVCGVKTSSGHEYEAKKVIVASGTTALNKDFDLDGFTIGIRAYACVDKPIEPTIHFHYKMEYYPGYAWVFPVSENEVNVGVYLDAEKYRNQSVKLREFLTQFIQNLPYSIEVKEETIKTWGIPVYNRDARRSGNGIFLVGDSAHFTNSLTGGGIYTAMVSGLLAGDCIVDNSKDYEVLWRKNIQGTLRLSSFIWHHIASRPRLFDMTLQLGNTRFAQRRVLRSIAGDHF